MKKRKMKKQLVVFFCFTLIFSIFAPYTVSYSQTLDVHSVSKEVMNGSFEDSIIPGWSLVTSNPSTSIEISEERVHSGTKSLYFNDSNANNPGNLQVTSERIAVTSGEMYTAKAFVNVVAQTHSIGFEVHYYNEAGQKVGTAAFINFRAADLGTNQWTEISVPFTVPEDAKQVELRFNSGHPSHTEAYFDDVKIVKDSDSTEIVPVNASFEEEVVIPGWSLVTNNPSTTIGFSEERTHTGSKSLYFKDDNSKNPGNLQVTSEKISVTPGESYTAKAFVNVVSQSQSIGFEVHYYNEAGQKVGTAAFINFQAADLGTNQWTEIQVPFDVPVGATQIEIRFNSGHPSITEAYFDDVTIESSGKEPPPEENINLEVLNPDFESPVEEGRIPGWASEFAGPGIEISTDRARSGVQSLHLLDTTDQAGVSALSDKIAVEAGSSYLLTVYANTVSQTHNVVTEIRYFDENNNSITEDRELNGDLPKNDWIDLKVFSVVPENAAYARLALYSGGISFTEVYFDDVTFQKVTDDSQLDREYAAPINLGEMVHVQLGQAGAIQENSLGENEVYYHSNGHPGTFSVLDAETGKLKFSQVIPNTEAVWAITIGPDKNVYFAGTADGKLYRYVPALKEVQDLGANPSEAWVWDIEAAPDGKIYGATYPGAGLFEYDIYTGTFRDLGPVTDQDYARGLMVDGDYIYVGIGTTKHLYKINRHTGEKEELILDGQSGENGMIQDVWAVNGKLLVAVSTIDMLVVDPETMKIEGSFQFSNMISEPDPNQPNMIYYKNGTQLYKYDLNLNKETLIEGIPILPDTPRVKDMAWITLASGETVLAFVTQYGEYMQYNPRMNSLSFVALDLAATAVAIQSLETGPDGKLYMGGYQRGMSVYNPFSDEIEVNISSFAQPEGIGFLGDNAYFGTYVGAIMYSYDPTQPVDLNSNPMLAYDIQDEQDRPFAITSGDNKLFVGTVPDYGVLGGVLAIYDDETKEWTQQRNVVQDQSIISLAYHDGKLFGGTSIWGGLGIDPKAEEAKIFVWDVEKGEKIAEFTPQIPGIDVTPRMIGDLSIGPDGYLWGAVEGTIFKMDPETYEVIDSKVIRPSLYNSSKWFPYRLEWGPDGMLYTTLSRSLIVIDPETLDYKVLVEDFMNSMTVGVDGSIYYAVGSELYKIPVPETDATLSSINIDGKAMEGFQPGKRKYTVPYDPTENIQVVAAQSGADIDVVHSSEETKIIVTGLDGISTLTYTIAWSGVENPGDGEGPGKGEDPGDGKDPSDGEDPNISQNPGEGKNPGNEKSPSNGNQQGNILPNTATTIYTNLFAGLLFFSVGVVLYAVSRRRRI
ncbi:carbohydrate binding domain-containing protein [Neobacillus muris]|uniref:carbohydrate binding domain-containing protein n=1 Tax=Neobacillus muris TaxID=2941334 RepID=UPI00203A5C93|nr:carbohydrate binding domain-containing protein [Neobacillus muris]